MIPPGLIPVILPLAKIGFILITLTGTVFMPAPDFLPKTASSYAMAGEATEGHTPDQEKQKRYPIEKNRLDQLLDRAENNFSRINTLATRLIQKKNISLFDEPIISQGICIFKNPDSIRLEYTSPFKSVLIISQDKISKYEEFGGKWKKLAGNEQITGIILSHIRAWLTGRFNEGGLYKVTGYEKKPPEKKSNTGLDENKARKQGIILVLTPKSPDFKKFIRAFELVLNKDLNRLEQITIREQEEDYTTIAFSHDLINKPVSDSIFDGSQDSPSPLPPEYKNGEK